MNNNIPNNLMDNVEKKLRKHIKSKRKKRYIYTAVAAAISLIVILPVSTFAYSEYNNSVFYKQEINLARLNKDITEVNETFTYKDVEFKIKEIFADDSGIEVIYDVSDPKYSINKITFGDKDNNEFDMIGYSLPGQDSNNTEKSFWISTNSNTTNYMTNNPVTITINNIIINEDEEDNNLIDKVSLLINNNDNLTVDWTFKMKIPLQEVVNVPVNKEYLLDIGTLKINSFKVGILKSVLDYTFVPTDSSISGIHPLFSLRLDKEYAMDNGGEDYGAGAIVGKSRENNYMGTGESKYPGGTQVFNSIYYRNIDEIGLKLIGVQANYNDINSTVYKVDKNNLPMDFDFNGEKFKITSMKENDDSDEYTVEYSKTNRIFSQLELNFLSSGGSDNTFENIQFTDQASRDTIYSLLSKKVPNLTAIENQFGSLQKGIVSTKITTTSRETEFTIGAVKNLIYDEDELIIHK